MINAAIIGSIDRQVYAPTNGFDYLDRDQTMRKAMDLLAVPRPGLARRDR